MVLAYLCIYHWARSVYCPRRCLSRPPSPYRAFSPSCAPSTCTISNYHILVVASLTHTFTYAILMFLCFQVPSTFLSQHPIHSLVQR